MPREITEDEKSFIRSLKRCLAKQPETCLLYFAANSANLHDVLEATDVELDPTQAIESIAYVGTVDCGDY